MRRALQRNILLLLSTAAIGLAACYGDPNGGTYSADGGDPGSTVDPANGDPGSNSGSSAGIPCDVLGVLQKECWSCHGTKPTSNAPMSLVSYADLTSPSPSDSTKTLAQMSAARMKDKSAPMPPSGVASASDTAILQNWVNKGTPQSTCATNRGGDAGTTATDSGPNPYATPVVCTSTKKWTSGDHGSKSMHPGLACVSCHKSNGGPTLTFGGTVYPTAHEPDDCNGTAGGLSVVVTDAKGKTVTMTVNSVGNFYGSTTGLSSPYTVKVTGSGGKVRAMSQKITTGDCNSCHTQNGASSAPGRIMAP